MNKVLETIRNLDSYEEKIPLYNLVGSEGDHDTRMIVDEFIEELKKGEKMKKKKCVVCGKEEGHYVGICYRCMRCEDCMLEKCEEKI